MAWLEEQTPEERFAKRASDVGGRDRDEAAAALHNVEESLRRADFMLYTAGRRSEEQYLAELGRLQGIRDELAQAVRPTLRRSASPA